MSNLAGLRPYADTPRRVAAVLAALRVVAAPAAQARFLPRPDYAVAIQGTRAFPEWRHQVVEWLQQVGVEFVVDTSIVATAVNFFDRVMSIVRVPSGQLQTAALACLFTACKMADTPSRLRMADIRRHFTEICTPADISRSELNILFFLRWDINAFTPIDTIHSVLQLVPDAHIQGALTSSAVGIHSLAMLDYDLLRFPPMMTGMACLSLACHLNGFDMSPLLHGLTHNGVALPRDTSCDQRVWGLYMSRYSLATALDAPHVRPPLASPAASTLAIDTPRSLVSPVTGGRVSVITTDGDVSRPTPARTSRSHGDAAASIVTGSDVEGMRRSFDCTCAIADDDMDDEEVVTSLVVAQRADAAAREELRTSRAQSCVSTASSLSAVSVGDALRSMAVHAGPSSGISSASRSISVNPTLSAAGASMDADASMDMDTCILHHARDAALLNASSTY